MILDDMEIEERLQRMTDVNLAFAGGDKCREHADALMERRREIHGILYPDPPDPKKRKAKTLQQVRAVAAMFGREL